MNSGSKCKYSFETSKILRSSVYIAALLKLRSTPLFVCFLIVAQAAYAVPDSGVAYCDGFDYPVGDRGYSSPYTGTSGIPGGKAKIPLLEGISPERNDWYPSNAGVAPRARLGSSRYGGWHNAQDTGSYLYTVTPSITFDGIHPGEDWNRGTGSNDVGDEIRAVANGKIVNIKSVTASGTSLGWIIIVKHWIQQDSVNERIVYSLYFHAVPPTLDGVVNTGGTIPSTNSKFVVGLGSPVIKGQLIGRIGRLVGLSPHLHIEMRNANFNPTGSVYPNAQGDGYYGSGGGGMTKTQMEAAFNGMRTDGVIDPSDFIDDNRTLFTATHVGNLKLTHPNKVEMNNCISLGIMNNTNDKAWFNVERTLSRGEVVAVMKSAANAYKTNYIEDLPNVNSGIVAFPNDTDLWASELRPVVQLFAEKGLIDVSNHLTGKFRVNDPASVGEAVHFLWRAFNLGSGGPSGAEALFSYRRDKLSGEIFLRPLQLDFDLNATTSPYYQRIGGILTRKVTARRDWLYQSGIGELKQSNYADPIRRHVAAKLVINTILWRITNPSPAVP